MTELFDSEEKREFKVNLLNSQVTVKEWDVEDNPVSRNYFKKVRELYKDASLAIAYVDKELTLTSGEIIYTGGTAILKFKFSGLNIDWRLSHAVGTFELELVNEWDLFKHQLIEHLKIKVKKRESVI